MDVCMVVNDIGGTWPVAKPSRKTISDMPESTSIHPCFALRNKNIYCIWMDDDHHTDQWNIHFSQGIYNENTDDWNWSSAERIAPSNGKQYYPSIVLDDEDNLHVFYSNKSNPVWHLKRTGNEWGNPKSISTANTSQTVFSFSRYTKGLLHTVVRQSMGGGDEGVFYVRGLPDGTFADPVLVTEAGFPEFPGVDIDSEGNAHVVWSSGSEVRPRNVYHAEVDLPGSAPDAVITASGTGGLVPFEIEFDASQSSDKNGKIIDYRWSFGDGTNASGKKVSHTFTEIGIYNVTLAVIDDDMRVGTDHVEITATTGKPVAALNASATSGMNPLTIVFNGSDSHDFNGEIVSYWWDFDDGTSDEGISVIHTYTAGGDYTAALTVEDNDGETGEDSVEIIVYQKPEASFIATPEIGVVPFVVNFDASASSDADGNIESYRWDFGDGGYTSGKKVSHEFTEVGIYMVNLSVIDNDDWVGTNQIEITASGGEPLAVINTSTSSGMNPLKVDFDGSDSSDLDGAITAYQWDFGDGTSDQGVSVAHTYTTAGKYTAKLTVKDNDGKTGEDSVEITVTQKPEASFTATPEIGVAPFEVSFDASASSDADGNIESYKWDFGDGTTGDSIKVTHTYSTQGTYLVILIATDNDNNIDSASKEIFVLEKPMAPVNVAVERLVNKTFLFSDYINKISWQENAENSGFFNIAQYRIYRKAQGDNDSQFLQVAEVSSGEFSYEDRGFSNFQEAAKYVYVVTAVDSQGNESEYSAYGSNI
jgi:PKD repeat protein